ncbi:MAG: hypothetical protein HY898_14035 [Deltaproteobacteria bacterium]|nr:hypothetical protein [Deltaproteobacteria bacterium]
MGFFSNLFGGNAAIEQDELRTKYLHFRSLLASNHAVLEIITALESSWAGGTAVTLGELKQQAAQLQELVQTMVGDLNVIAEGRYGELVPIARKIGEGVDDVLKQVKGVPLTKACIALEQIGRDLADAVGGKTANLGEARNQVGLLVPPGFAVTAFAYRAFVEGAGIQHELDSLWSGIDWDDWSSIARASGAMRSLVLRAAIPQDVAEEITLSAHDLRRKVRGKTGISIRSSAIGEDGGSTFAGQYATFLSVPPEQVLRRYKEIVASKFTERALFYMHAHGFRERDLAMAVGCFGMIDAVAAGVGYSVDPTVAGLDRMVVSAVWGLGKPVVDGTVTPDTYVISRRPGKGILSVRIAPKQRRIIATEKGGPIEEDVPEELQTRACLTDDQIMTIADYLRVLETHYRCPQDVEWAMDKSKRIFILQTRPLRLPDRPSGSPAEEPDQSWQVRFEGGVTASPGVGSGKVVRCEPDGALARFPAGGVLVARQNSPQFVEVMTRASGIVTEVGSPTGHMSSLAREFRVPTIVDAGPLTCLQEGMEVTVDATRCKVYDGRVDALLVEDMRRTGSRRDSPTQAVLERMIARVARLNLTDPSKNSFRAKSCATYHDITRFCHEMAISEMFSLNDYRNLPGKGMAFRLDTEVPLAIYVIDLGGGLVEGAADKMVRPEQIASTPMRALWRGVTSPGVRWAGARPIDLKGFVSAWANTMYDAAKEDRRLGDSSYAIVGASYLNFGSRLGYHFTMLDSICGESLHDNYILFRFKGGAADIERRMRRTRFVAEALAQHGFVVDQKQDLLNAWVKKLPAAALEERLVVVGQLIGCARQLDVVMDTEATLEECLAAFMRGDFGFFDFKG